MKISDIRKKMKRNRILFFTYKKITDPDYRAGFVDYLTHKNIKPKETIRREISLVKDYWKCNPMHYYRYRLYNKELSNQELTDYIPPYYFYNFHMPSMYDNIDISFTNSKIMLNDYLISKNIETPTAVALIKKGKIFDNIRGKLLFEELIENLIKSNSGIFFIKPDKGMGGKGIFIIRKKIITFMLVKNCLMRNYLQRKSDVMIL